MVSFSDDEIKNNEYLQVIFDNSINHKEKLRKLKSVVPNDKILEFIDYGIAYETGRRNDRMFNFYNKLKYYSYYFPHWY